jgi:phosphopantothenate---cysteine ligase (CTP)
MKKILLTSGGTRVQIDRVRHIGNMSHGTFGSRIGRRLLDHQDAHLFFLAAEGSRLPFSMDVNWASRRGRGDILDDLLELRKKCRECSNRYEECTYKTFEDYQEKLFSAAEWMPPDVVVLAAAASDYLVGNYVDGKIRSKDSLSIQLTPAPKLISQIKQRAPKAKLVGFKLLVDSTEEELVAAARGSIVDNGCDLVVANDLRDIQDNNHTLLLVDSAGVERYVADQSDPEYLATVVAGKIMDLARKQ